MAMRRQKNVVQIAALGVGLVLVLGVLGGCGGDEPNQPEEMAPDPNNASATTAARDTSADPLEAATRIFREPKVDLDKVIQGAETWYPAYESWKGKAAPDITLTDIQGDTHTLSDYEGRNVVLVFCATWCGPCKLEVPHLKELRENMAEDKLAILAVSNESPALVKSFAESNELNYTVLLNPGGLPAPYSEVTNIPSSLFIDPQGVIKLGTLGIVPTADAEAIVQAG
jgi:peroxiredoxin